jgi:hypothetical protein
MSKRRPAFDAGQLAFSFEPASPPAQEGGLFGLDRAVGSAISQILKDDPRSRFEVAGAMSAMLGDEVSKAMLDAYSAEAKDGHNISVARFLALIAQSGRFDVLDALVRRIGAHVVVGEESLTVELGHIETQMERLKARRGVLKRIAPAIQRASAAK